MPLNLLRSPNDKPKGAGFVPILGRVDFYPAMDLLRRMTYDGGKKCLADMLRENMYLGLLRRDLASVLRPQDIPGPKEAEWKLGNSIKVKISPKDFITGQGEAEPLLVARRAAQQFGLIAPQS